MKSPSCLICLFSYNRYSHLKLTLRHLMKDLPDSGCKLALFDDGSDDERVGKLLTRKLVKNGDVVCVKTSNNKIKPTSTREAADRIGEQRKRATDFFLESDFDYLFLLDDDVAVSCSTIREAIDDFEFLRKTDYLKPGAITLHNQLNVDAYINVGGKVFSSIHLTGEAHIIFHRESLEKVGNRFCSGKGGFADTQLNALMKAGYDYLERTFPAYSVQHFGFGPHGSVVHEHQEKVPMWNEGPYRSNWKHGKGRPLEVPGFDLRKYCMCVQRFGGREAPLHYMGEKDV